MTLETDAEGNPILIEDAVPPSSRVPPRVWLRENLFSSPANSMLSLLFGALIAWVGYRTVRWVFVTAEWEIVRRNLTGFMIGRFPRDELWRPWASAMAVAAGIGIATGATARLAREAALERGERAEEVRLVSRARRWWPMVLLVVVLLLFTETVTPWLLTAVVGVVGAVAFVVGRSMPSGVRRFAWLIGLGFIVLSFQALMAFGGVGWDRWGGLHLSLFATVAGILIAFPLGLLLAMGRRSSLPVVRGVSTAYIEFFRGVPLITLLLMAQFAVRFFFPPGFPTPSLLTRAMIVIVLFEAAYIAEIVRGGLQAVPKGQVEAAQAVGLSPWKVNRLIVLPQALRAVIPAMVGQFISLFQDTTLFTVISLVEVLHIARTVTSQPDFVGQGLSSVTLPFVAFIFWAVSYTMSRESQRLERRLRVGER